jgi:S-DNA-T family DNA segregation ATPase FtsK/SpoIIIE
MAYQVRQRDPLFDSTTQAVIERRGKELLGLVLLTLAVLAAMILGSYSPDDPSWLAATEEPAQNLLGRFGASIAQPTTIIVGWAGWGASLAFAAWGLRFLFHVGEERALNRAIFTPIAIAVAAVYAATHVPPPDWTHSFGLGGLFGDTVLGAVLNVSPFGAAAGLKTLSLLLAAGTLALGLFVLGATAEEMKALGRFLYVGVVMTYALILRGLRLLGRTGAASLNHAGRAAAVGAVAAGRQAADWNARRRADRAAPAAADDPDAWDDDLPAVAAPPQRTLKDFVPGLLRRPAPAADGARDEPPVSAATPSGDERLRARISDAVRSGYRPKPVIMLGRAEPPLVRTAAPAVAAATPVAVLEDDPDVDADAYDAEEAYEPPYVPVPDTRRVVQPAPRKPAPSRQAQSEAQPRLALEPAASGYETPPLSLLTNPAAIQRHHPSNEALEENARMLEAVLDDYGVKGEITSVRPGPVVTMYELEPAPGLKASRVIGLADDIARSMSALSARVSTVPGRSVIGIELPNAHREKVVLREILAARDFGDGNQRLPLALGKDIAGEPIVANLAKMPHLLIAGTTGSGKSVAINTMILSLLYKLSPAECRLIMIDPKMLELSVYDGIPHLLSPVVTDPKKAVVALKWVVGEMEERYRKMSKMGVRNIEGYNGRVADALSKNEVFTRTVQTGFDDETGDPVFETEEIAPVALPYIVVIVDEMADLMMVAGKEIEACIQRLAQMARASGIHLIMATQRPSVDVITGTIKANFPTRISFQVTSKIDSRTILGEMGAEQLLGMGDMLFMAGGGRISRVHGPFVSDEEVEEVVSHLKSFGPPEYVSTVLEGPSDEDRETSVDEVLGLGTGAEGDEALYDMAVQIVARDRKCSTSYIQRKLAIGYNKAARLVEQMEDNGVVSRANQVGKREILVPEVQ